MIKIEIDLLDIEMPQPVSKSDKKNPVIIGKKRSVVCDKKRRLIIIQNSITEATPVNFERALLKLLKKKRKPIIVMVTGPGGDAFASFKIYHIIRKYCHQATITTVGYNKLVCSGALLILQAGEYRFLSKKPVLGMHQAEGIFSPNSRMNIHSCAFHLTLLSRIDGQQLHILTERGRPIKKIYRLFNRDASISPANALRLNLIDGVIKSGNLTKIYELVLQELRKK